MTQTRLNYHKGEVVFEPEHDVDVTAIPVDVNETTVIRLKPKQPLAPSKTLKRERHYAFETAIKSDGNEQLFEISTEKPDKIVHARLNIGIHRGGGLNAPLRVFLNDEPIKIDNGDASEFSEFFAPLDAVVPASILRDKNEIKVTAQKGATITSVQLVVQRK